MIVIYYLIQTYTMIYTDKYTFIQMCNLAFFCFTLFFCVKRPYLTQCTPTFLIFTRLLIHAQEHVHSPTELYYAKLIS